MSLRAQIHFYVSVRVLTLFDNPQPNTKPLARLKGLKMLSKVFALLSFVCTLSVTFSSISQAQAPGGPPPGWVRSRPTVAPPSDVKFVLKQDGAVLVTFAQNSSNIADRFSLDGGVTSFLCPSRPCRIDQFLKPDVMTAVWVQAVDSVTKQSTAWVESSNHVIVITPSKGPFPYYQPLSLCAGDDGACLLSAFVQGGGGGAGGDGAVGDTPSGTYRGGSGGSGASIYINSLGSKGPFGIYVYVGAGGQAGADPKTGGGGGGASGIYLLPDSGTTEDLIIAGGGGGGGAVGSSAAPCARKPCVAGGGGDAALVSGGAAGDGTASNPYATNFGKGAASAMAGTIGSTCGKGLSLPEAVGQGGTAFCVGGRISPPNTTGGRGGDAPSTTEAGTQGGTGTWQDSGSWTSCFSTDALFAITSHDGASSCTEVRSDYQYSSFLGGAGGGGFGGGGAGGSYYNDQPVVGGGGGGGGSLFKMLENDLGPVAGIPVWSSAQNGGNSVDTLPGLDNRKGGDGKVILVLEPLQ